MPPPSACGVGAHQNLFDPSSLVHPRKQWEEDAGANRQHSNVCHLPRSASVEVLVCDSTNVQRCANGWAGNPRGHDHNASQDRAPSLGQMCWPQHGSSSDNPEACGRSCKNEAIPRRGCTAGGKLLQESDFEHCPTPQSFVRCGPHHRVELCVLSREDVEQLHHIWWQYRDDLTWPWFEKKPQFSNEDFGTFRTIAQKVVDVMVEEYRQPMVLDQATISNTNHVGHPPHADNVQFDSVWWKGRRIRAEDEVVAAREGAYVLWRPEKTSYRSYSCTVSLSHPHDFEGGEVQFFHRFGDREPIASYKCASGCGVAFCGCQRNIHAVTGVTSGFRLVLLVWTRPPMARVPESQMHVCYFRPGTGLGVWLTTADLLKHPARECDGDAQAWVPVDDDDSTCECSRCAGERKKLAWKDHFEAAALSGETWRGKATSATPTPTTSAGDSPRNSEHPASEFRGSPRDTEEIVAAFREAPRHCPWPRNVARCTVHERRDLIEVLNPLEVRDLHVLWKKYRDDLTHPWYERKPEFSRYDLNTFRCAVQKVVDAMTDLYGQPLVIDQAIISCTNSLGHPPHADNVQLDSVWWHGRQVRQRDELVAAQGGAEVLWRYVKTQYRNYGASVALTNHWQYGGGDLEFYAEWGENEPSRRYRLDQGNGVAYCGCESCIHAVTGVRWGLRLELLVWTRSPDTAVPKEQKHVCFFRPGTGLSVWLTTAELEAFAAHPPLDGGEGVLSEGAESPSAAAHQDDQEAAEG